MTLPANQAVQFLYYADGHYYYAGHCCNNQDPHTSIIVSYQQISPLGCGGGQLAKPIGVEPEVGLLTAEREEGAIALDPSDFKSTNFVGERPIPSDGVVFDHPSSIKISVVLREFRISNKSDVDARLRSRTFRLLKIEGAKLPDGTPFPADLHFADWCRRVGGNPSEIVEVDAEGERRSKHANIPGRQGNIYRMRILHEKESFETWLVYRVNAG